MILRCQQNNTTEEIIYTLRCINKYSNMFQPQICPLLKKNRNDATFNVKKNIIKSRDM